MVALFLLGSSRLQALEIGAERVRVLNELGRPTSSVTRGDTEVMTYPGGVRITLKNRRVLAIVGLKPARAVAAPTAPPPAESPPSDELLNEPVMTKAEADEFATMEKEQADANAEARAKMERAIEEMEHLHDHPAAPPKVAHIDLKEFLVGLVLKFLLTLAALKLTCKYWGVEVFWNGLITVAIVDALLRGALGAVGILWLQMPSLFYADEAIAAIAMMLILRKVSINQSMGQAVQITMTTKTFSIVVGSLLFTVLLNLIK